MIRCHTRRRQPNVNRSILVSPVHHAYGPGSGLMEHIGRAAMCMVTITELRTHVGEYLRRAESGERFYVTV